MTRLQRWRRCVVAALVLANLATAIQLGRKTVRLLAPSQPMSAPTADAIGRDESLAVTPDVQIIIDAHLFGKADAPADSYLSAATQPSVSLLGLVETPSPRLSRAIFNVDGNIVVVGIDQAIAENMFLRQVGGGAVDIEWGGQRRSIRLPQPTLRSRTLAFIPKPRLDAYSQNSLQDVPLGTSEKHLVSVARPAEIVANGEVLGYKLYPRGNRASFYGLGLQPGDLLVAVNGVPLNDRRTAMPIVKALRAGSNADLTLKRAGNEISVHL